MQKRIQRRWSKGSRAIAGNINGDIDVGILDILQVLVAAIEIHTVQKHIYRRIGELFVGLRHLQIHTNDDVGTHGTRHIDREIVADTTIHIDHRIDGNRRKGRRNGHRCSHAGGQIATGKHFLASMDGFGADTGKRNRHIPEIERIRQKSGEFLEELHHIRATQNAAHSRGGQTAGHVNNIAQKVALVVLLATQGLLDTVIRIVGDELDPILAADDLPHRVRRITRTVHGTDNRTNRRTHNQIDRQARILDSFQRWDMRHTLGATTRQHHSNRGAILLAYGIELVILGEQVIAAEQQDQTNSNKCIFHKLQYLCRISGSSGIPHVR